MAIEPFIFPLNGITPHLEPNEFFLLTFWALFLPMFVATVGVFVLRRIDLNIEVSGRVKLMLPVLYVGLCGIWFLLTGTIQFYSYLPTEFFMFFISIPAVLGFLQAYFSYPDRDRFYVVVFVVVLIALWSFLFWSFGEYNHPMGFGVGAIQIAPLLSAFRIIGMIVLSGSPIAYFVFLGFTYRWSPDSKVFSESVMMRWLLVTVIYSPFFLFLSFLLIEFLLPF